MTKGIIVRFPPSPTGLLHIGGVRTALYNWLFARKNEGKFLLRIEDTDKERSKPEFEQNIYDSLKWLGLEHDGEVLKQSQRTEIYKKKIQELIQKGAAYIAEEQKNENREARPLTPERSDGGRVVRFRNPGGKIKFQDLIRGEVEMEVGDLNDFIIAKNIDEPLYHLAVVVDDLESGVTHLIRGEDHISNTPRQILLLEALGGERPIYAHLPLVLAPDKSKLSKRKHGESVSLNFYREKGYEPEAILNFVAMIGWNPGTDKEIFSLPALIEAFDLSKVQKKGGVFDVVKLNWVNKEHLKLRKEKTKKLIEEKLQQIFPNKNINPVLIELLFERVEVISQINELHKNQELNYFFNEPELDVSKIPWKKQSTEEAKKNLEKVLEMLDNKEKISEFAEKVGKGEVLWPLRYALSGMEKSPDPFTLIDILGVEESKRRIQNAIEKI